MREGDFNSHCLKDVFLIFTVRILNEFYHSDIFISSSYFLIGLLVGYCTVFQVLCIHLTSIECVLCEEHGKSPQYINYPYAWVCSEFWTAGFLIQFWIPSIWTSLVSLVVFSLCMYKAQSLGKRSFSAMMRVISLSLPVHFLFRPTYSDLISSIFTLVYITWCEWDTRKYNKL